MRKIDKWIDRERKETGREREREREQGAQTSDKRGHLARADIWPKWTFGHNI